MEALGINIGYFLGQLLAILLLALLVIGPVFLVFLLIKLAIKPEKTELLMTAEVTQQGVLVPRQLLHGATEVEIRRKQAMLLLVPVVKEA
ncbi:MAG: hypothetical protein L0332_32155 [Chloroflexi bacterium]|nr:hypothetical protein [Chloroflexota bacterium]MCI0577241.1 hypothetical protein [Chloroflexota bacterium]MCI0646722.1 hypothetical protein [Chloroflexota bacterium]MCI0731356.1 hypothetical protein [Chloroflexota bacterium]